MPKFPKNKGYKSPVKHHSMSVDSKKVKAGHYHDPKKGIVTVKKDRPKINPAPYAPFKMKHASGNPMKANFKSAFQIHDGKKFEDAGFMDSHFPSGKARTPAKKLHDQIKQDEKDKKTIKGNKIVRRMKQLEKKLKLDPKDKAAKDELLKLSTTSEGQRYTDTGGIERSPNKKLNGATKNGTSKKLSGATKNKAPRDPYTFVPIEPATEDRTPKLKGIRDWHPTDRTKTKGRAARKENRKAPKVKLTKPAKKFITPRMKPASGRI